MSQARELTRARPRRSIDVGDSFSGAAFKGDGGAPGPAPDVWIVPQGGSLWDPSNSESMVAVILEGAISIRCMNLDGRTMFVGSLVAPAFIDADEFSSASELAYLVGAENECRILYCSKDWFYRKLSENPWAILPLFESRVHLLAALQKTSLSATTSQLMPKVAAMILESTQSGVGIMPMTHQQIAERLGVSRPSVTRTLLRLQSAGVIRTHSGAVELLDRSRLLTKGALQLLSVPMAV